MFTECQQEDFPDEWKFTLVQSLRDPMEPGANEFPSEIALVRVIYDEKLKTRCQKLNNSTSRQIMSLRGFN